LALIAMTLLAAMGFENTFSVLGVANRKSQSCNSARQKRKQ
jgi:hypothetical protein